jgi:3,4-dihydroxy 2-butanone 4-phosphate synthase/GTP cyclohydrolase II
LVELGVTTMRLMTNNPAKRGGLEGFGLKITSRVPIKTVPNPENIRYLETKRKRLGHLLDHADTESNDTESTGTEGACGED